MSGREARVRPSDILREAARLMVLDGWSPDLGVKVMAAERHGRFYREGSLGEHVFRAYQTLRAGWYTMVRAQEALFAFLGLTGERPLALCRWERTPGLTQSKLERTLLRAAHAFDTKVLAA